MQKDSIGPALIWLIVMTITTILSLVFNLREVALWSSVVFMFSFWAMIMAEVRTIIKKMKEASDK